MGEQISRLLHVFIGNMRDNDVGISILRRAQPMFVIRFPLQRLSALSASIGRRRSVRP